MIDPDAFAAPDAYRARAEAVVRRQSGIRRAEDKLRATYVRLDTLASRTLSQADRLAVLEECITASKELVVILAELWEAEQP